MSDRHTLWGSTLVTRKTGRRGRGEKEKKERDWGDVRSIKGLLQRPEDLSSVPSTHIKGGFHDVHGQS